MPPRTRKLPTRNPGDLTVTVDTDTTPDSTTNGDTSNTDGEKRDYTNRVTDTDTGLTGDFAIVTAGEVPAVVRDRGRVNQFDQPVLKSYQEDFANEVKHGKGGSWVSGRVANLDAAEKQARNAATHMGQLHSLPIGIEVRKLPDDTDHPNGAGVIYFRGKEKRDKAPAKTS